MADHVDPNAEQNAADADIVMDDVPFVFEPPTKFGFEDEQGKPIELERDPAKHYVQFTGQRTRTQTYKWYVAFVAELRANSRRRFSAVHARASSYPPLCPVQFGHVEVYVRALE